MQNSERGQFEQSWKSAFDGAEMAPSDRLWDSIEVDLASNETAAMKRRVVFYQRLAAATVIFALLSGAYAIYNNGGSEAELASTQTTQPAVNGAGPSSTPKNDIVPSQSGNSATGSSTASIPQESKTLKPQRIDRDTPTIPQMSPVVAIAESPRETNTVVADEGVPETDPLVDQHKAAGETVLAENNTQVTEKEEQVVKLLSADEINALAEAEAKENEKETKNARSLWLGLGGAAGSYSPSASVMGGGLAQADQATTAYSLGQTQATPQSYSDNVGSAFSAGVSGGLRVARRWVVQTGLNYISQQVDYTTNFVGVSSGNKAFAMTRDYIAESSSANDIAVTSQYEVLSTTEMLSVPMQAGYLIVDRKFGWQINTGVSTDLLLRNTLTDKSGVRDEVSEGAGKDSPYRSVNWAALLSTEVSYKIGNQFRLAFVPGMRYSFRPMLKNENATGSPFVLDLGFRLNYLFN